MSLFLLLQQWPRLSSPSYMYGFRDGRLVAVQLLLCGMLLQGFIQYDL